MFAERVEALREQNRELLKRLKFHGDTQEERLSGSSGNRRRESDDEAEETDKLGQGEGRPARATLGKSSVRFAEESTSRRKHPQDQQKPVGIKSCLVDRSKKQSDEEEEEVCNPVASHPDESEGQSPAADSHHLQPLLGYDWIAGVLDNDDSLLQRSDQFFNDLRVFRSLNKDECVHSTDAEFSEENLSGSHLLKDMGDREDIADSHTTHQCTFSYRINSRLFPVPLQSQECCPVCKKHKSSHPHTIEEPAQIRVSVPLTALLPPYKYKAHRRCSFNPSDSLGLPSHCLSGWSNTGQRITLPPSSLDLRSSLKINASATINKEMEKMSSNQEELSVVTRLAPHNFLHFFPKRKRRTTSHPKF